jgi:hypothetical protein
MLGSEPKVRSEEVMPDVRTKCETELDLHLLRFQPRPQWSVRLSSAESGGEVSMNVISSRCHE